MKILILGYYDRHNIGDEMFKFVFRNYFDDNWPNHDLIIKNTDDLDMIPEDIDIVICGGGDLINDYFMNKIHHLIEPIKDRIPIYAIGIGFPYGKMLDQGALDCFDFVAHRNQTDQDKLLNIYGPNRVKYYPDLGFMLPNWSANGISTEAYRKMGTMGWNNGVIKTDKDKCQFKKIGVFLSKTIYHPDNPEAYRKIIDSLAYFLVKLARKRKSKKILSCLPSQPEYQIFLISCCTNDLNEREDDRKINEDLYRRIGKYENCDNIHIINQRMEMEEVIPIFKQFYFTICTRFHAHIFSLLAKVPILSIYSSRKVENLLQTHDLVKYGIKMEVDPAKLYPLKLDIWPLFEKYLSIRKGYKSYLSKLTLIEEVNKIGIKKLVNVMNNLIWTPIKRKDPESPAFKILVENKTREVAQKIIKYLLPDLEDQKVEEYAVYMSDYSDARLRIIDLIEIKEGKAKQNATKTIKTKSTRTIKTKAKAKTKAIKSRKTKQKDRILFDQGIGGTGVDNNDDVRNLTEILVFTLTGSRITDFNWGLQNQIMTHEYNLYESVKWILTVFNQGISLESILNNPTLIKYRKFDMKYFRQHDLKGFHRSGWSYVVGHLESFHNPNGPIFDSFLDKTFGWNYDFYQLNGVLPFTKSWAGVFHHTFNDQYSQNSLVEVFKKPLFLTSLATCRGLYVLSEYLKNLMLEKLNELGFSEIKVEVLIHPTELVNTCFDFDKFIKNSERKVIQIGAWYRNTYAIYQLSSLKHLKKCALKGKNMDNYYIDQDKANQVTDHLLRLGNKWTDEQEDPVCRPHEVSGDQLQHRCNKYLIGMIEMIENNYSQVEVIEQVSNQEYDRLLTENVVLINLVDASAVNTIIECIVRRTPIIINRLPAVEEYLGKDYPLYYTDLNHAADILNDLDLLKCGHEYLQKLDLDKFHINSFLHSLLNSEIYQNV